MLGAVLLVHKTPCNAICANGLVKLTQLHPHKQEVFAWKKFNTQLLPTSSLYLKIFRVSQLAKQLLVECWWNLLQITKNGCPGATKGNLCQRNMLKSQWTSSEGSIKQKQQTFYLWWHPTIPNGSKTILVMQMMLCWPQHILLRLQRDNQYLTWLCLHNAITLLSGRNELIDVKSQNIWT